MVPRYFWRGADIETAKIKYEAAETPGGELIDHLLVRFR